MVLMSEHATREISGPGTEDQLKDETQQTGPRRPARLADIAALVGVSVATVSRALNGVEGVSDEQRNRIIAEAERLGYVRDAVGHSLRLGRNYLVGAWLESIENASSGRFVSALTDALQPHGYDILVTEYSHDPVQDQSRIVSLARRRPDFMVVLHPPRQEAFARLREQGHEVVLVSSGPADEWDGPLVSVDSSQSRLDMATDLVQLGHRRILVTQPARRFGRPGAGVLRRVVREAELPLEVEALPIPDGDKSGALDDVIARLLQPDAPTCLQVNEAMAAPLLTRLRDAGFRIPEDLSVLTTGATAWAELVTPALGCTEVDYYACGLAVADVLLALRDGKRPELRVVQGRYVRRGSVGPARHLITHNGT